MNKRRRNYTSTKKAKAEAEVIDPICDYCKLPIEEEEFCPEDMGHLKLHNDCYPMLEDSECYRCGKSVPVDEHNCADPSKWAKAGATLRPEDENAIWICPSCSNYPYAVCGVCKKRAEKLRRSDCGCYRACKSCLEACGLCGNCIEDDDFMVVTAESKKSVYHTGCAVPSKRQKKDGE